MMNRILIVEDEKKIARFLQLELEHEGYEVESCHDGRSGLERALSGEFSLIVLDIMLPGLNGMEVCRRVRGQLDVPIIMLTAKDDTMDKVMGLDIGADDYMTKPFAIEELFARIRRLFRRSETAQREESNVIKKGMLVLDMDSHQVTCGGEEISLTKREFDFLAYLMTNEGIALTRDQILENVWGYDFYGDTNIVDVYVRYLRSKIDNRFSKEFIHTVRGVGYLFKHEK
ncbi:DNA-binding response regulator, OmpR family, contains REC and winged-helix (wHTH) domain [Peptoclostridium litorale DSM 5388]|uniref:Stage 0 sporulation protein A homolog n=1 Tax=Peptoclostridium litorale DSM 5388 TaxID=1121324 RepID=A0A069RI37_PEPLI|nr:response regulator transcription factor [Peptoclostridium litorale]KDR96689.1 Two component transcriptional regulator, winged helix family [Peptoclostridium litorale DSM 5388]SIN67706.1 DNA-binding response regulator, OmpR family, contains REC and winged-helix (wHTH) domain [Peptoclostridium litorale DSM 5388]